SRIKITSSEGCPARRNRRMLVISVSLVPPGVDPVLRGCRAALVLLAVSALLRAQSTNALLSGRITDPSKALVAGARVAAVSYDTGVRYETITNVAGEYYLANLPPGGYRIEIEKSGFTKLVKPDVNLHVQDNSTIDFEMRLGPASESVTVEAGA